MIDPTPQTPMTDPTPHASTNSPAPSPGRLETPDPTAEPQGTSVDLPRVEAAVRELLAAIGEDPERDGLLDTPARVARMYADARIQRIFGGTNEIMKEVISRAL